MTKSETYISRQARRLSKGQIDRRRFVMSALATGVTMPTAMSLASRAEAAAPKPGGHLRYGIRSSFDIGSEGWLRLNLARGSTLVARSRGGDLTGDLAETFKADKDGMVWSFTLRPDVKFHSGKPVTAEDVAASLSEAGRVFPEVRKILSQVARIETSAHQLRVTLHRPHREFAALLADPHLVVLPSEDGRVDQSVLDGTGVYRVDSIETQGGLRLARNPDHWSRAVGHFDTVDLRPLPDDRLRQSAMMAGEVDVIDAVDPRALAMLSSLPDVGIAESQGGRHIALDMHMPDLSLRTALREAIDRNALLERAYLGHGSVGCDTPVREHRIVRPQERARTPPRQVTLAVDTNAVATADVFLAALNMATGDAGFRFVPVQPGEPPSLTLRDCRAYAGEVAALTNCTVSNEAASDFATVLQAAQSATDAATRRQYLDAAHVLLAQHGTRLVPLWTNDLIAYSGKLAHDDRHKGPDDVITHWWFG